MENYQGDLADIVRASGGGGGGSSSTLDEPMIPDWKFPSELLNFPSGLLDELPSDDFGDPFSNMRDPLLHELDIVGSSSTFFNNNNSNAPSNNNDMLIKTSSVGGNIASGYGVGDGGNNILGRNNIIIDEEMKRPAAAGCNIFSRMLQISPNAQLPIDSSSSPGVLAASPRREIIKTPALVSNDMINANSSKVCLIENAGLQISSPRNPGIKRRKSQSKQVVCIPAPAPANSRPTGEVVPSDLWAWRKYGQKPIKGSPYPRGYYRCSSSKGCSARKQVERSRADPNMLVITYTSEHNHPWPTQRNALAGSTRTQPSKSSTSASKGSPSPQPQKTTSMKEEAKDNVSSILSGSTTTTAASVKEEIGGDIGKEIDMDDGEFSEGFPQSYKPAMPADSYQPEDTNLYAGLGELEPDLLFNQGFSGDKDRESKALDPLFSMFDWSVPGNNTSFGDQEAKEGFITRP